MPHACMLVCRVVAKRHSCVRPRVRLCVGLCTLGLAAAAAGWQVLPPPPRTSSCMMRGHFMCALSEKPASGRGTSHKLGSAARYLHRQQHINMCVWVSVSVDVWMSRKS